MIKTPYTPEEAARVLRCTRRSVYNYIRDGYLKASKMGRTWRITEEHLEEFINRGTKNNYLPPEN